MEHSHDNTPPQALPGLCREAGGLAGLVRLDVPATTPGTWWWPSTASPGASCAGRSGRICWCRAPLERPGSPRTLTEEKP